MKKYIFSIFVLIAIILSCKSKHTFKAHSVSHAFLDTLIFTDRIDLPAQGENKVLSDSIAEIALQEYFIKLGYYQEKDSANTNFEKDLLLCASVDTLWQLHLNNDRFIDAIVEYQDAPCYGSSYCYVPHTGIIASNNGKYKFIGPDVIPQSFYIDSIKPKQGYIEIYGGDYDCSEHEVIRKYRALIVPR
jgi:hypothetical protein